MEKLKSTRERILMTLLTSPRSTVESLAKAVGINAISVRHHLNNLQAGGLVVAEEERHGIGRPRLVYSLSEKGGELFPTSYLRLMNHLLTQMKRTFSKPAVDRLFNAIAEAMLDAHSAQVASLSLEDRLNLAQQILQQEGFTVRWENAGGQYLLHEISCPYYQIGQNHPEVCQLDQKLIGNILAAPVRKVNCVLNGDVHCTYEVALPQSIQEKPVG